MTLGMTSVPVSWTLLAATLSFSPILLLLHHTRLFPLLQRHVSFKICLSSFSMTHRQLSTCFCKWRAGFKTSTWPQSATIWHPYYYYLRCATLSEWNPKQELMSSTLWSSNFKACQFKLYNFSLILNNSSCRYQNLRSYFSTPNLSIPWNNGCKT